MNSKSMKSTIHAALMLHTNDLRNYAKKKVAEAQGPNDQEENALWCDFVDCLKEASEAAAGIKIDLLNQEEVEEAKL